MGVMVNERNIIIIYQQASPLSGSESNDIERVTPTYSISTESNTKSTRIAPLTKYLTPIL